MRFRLGLSQPVSTSQTTRIISSRKEAFLILNLAFLATAAVCSDSCTYRSTFPPVYMIDTYQNYSTAVTFAMFSCMGGEMTAMTAGESKEPWKDVPVVMSFVYLVPLSLYPFVLMSAAANVNYADHALSVIWGAGSNAMTISPFVVAIQTSALRGLSKMLHLFFIISAYTAA
jgi:amino acid permease